MHVKCNVLNPQMTDETRRGGFGGLLRKSRRRARARFSSCRVGHRPITILSGGPCREFLFSRERQSARGSCAQSLNEAFLGCTGCQGIPSPFRCPPVPLNLPFPFRCPIRCPFGNNNNGNVVILLALRPSTIIGRRGASTLGAPRVLM